MQNEVEVDVGVGVEVDVGVEVGVGGVGDGVGLTISVGWGGWLEIWRVKLISTQLAFEVKVGSRIITGDYCLYL